ncbi:MAG TPA: hypothetical protein VK186_01340 [Candidatus Deferrimicrobium sp.]|nr:hypothetical protein [Candidatus Deferrimicrobium sp.]
MKKKEVRFMLFQCRCWALITAILLFTLAGQAAVPTAKGAIDEAARTGQFLLLTFYNTQDPALTALSTTIADFRKSTAKKTAIYNANISDPNEKETVDRYKTWRARLPLLLVIAPNGALTGGYQQTATQDQLKQSVEISELNLKILKQLQEGKVVLVSLQNNTTQFNMESAKAIDEFTSDAQFKQYSGSVLADPTAQDSQEFLKQVGLTEPITEATVVILMPPSTIGKILKGNITKADISNSLQACTAGSGCCPGKK